MRPGEAIRPVGTAHWETSDGTAAIAEERPTRWRRRRRIHMGSTICSETSGNGPRIGMGITPSRRRAIRQGQAAEQDARCAVVPGPTIRDFCVNPSVRGPYLATVTTSLGYAGQRL